MSAAMRPYARHGCGAAAASIRIPSRNLAREFPRAIRKPDGHVTAWIKDGATDIANCQMLCKTHNRAKGNR